MVSFINKSSIKQTIGSLLKLDSFIIEKNKLDAKNVPLMLGSRSGYDVVNPFHSLLLLDKALSLLEETLSNKGQILLICDRTTYKKEFPSLSVIDKSNIWPEGSLSNFIKIKKMSYIYKNAIKSKAKVRAKFFFEKYQSAGFLKTPPRLAICLNPYENSSLFSELKLLDIPLICLTDNLSLKESIDYPVFCDLSDEAFLNFFSLLIEESIEKSQNKFISKFVIRKKANKKLKGKINNVESLVSLKQGIRSKKNNQFYLTRLKTDLQDQKYRIKC